MWWIIRLSLSVPCYNQRAGGTCDGAFRDSMVLSAGLFAEIVRYTSSQTLQSCVCDSSVSCSPPWGRGDGWNGREEVRGRTGGYGLRRGRKWECMKKQSPNTTYLALWGRRFGLSPMSYIFRKLFSGATLHHRQHAFRAVQQLLSFKLDCTYTVHVTGSALSVVGPSLLQVRQSGTRYHTVSVTWHSPATASDNR